MLFCKPQQKIPLNLSIHIGSADIHLKTPAKFLGMFVDTHLDWHEHIECMLKLKLIHHCMP